MNVMAIKQIGRFLSKNSSTILTGLGVTGVFSTTILGIEATPKALRIIDDERISRIEFKEDEILTTQDIVKLTWKCYIPTLLMAVTTVGCIIGANSVGLRRNAALASMFSLTEATLKEYQEKIIEVVGEKKAQKITDEVYGEKMRKKPVDGCEVINTGKGDMLCFEVTSGRYFKSDIEVIRRIQNELNESLLTDDFIPLNDLYEQLGLPYTSIGDDMGWDVEDGLIKVKFSSQLTENHIPCLVIDSDPKFNFRENSIMKY